MQLILLSFVFFLSSCTNLSSYKTAKAIPPGTWELGVGGGYFPKPTEVESILSTSSNATSGLPYYGEFVARGGVRDKVDVGVRYTLPASVSIDIKRELFHLGALDFATGLGVGFLNKFGKSSSPDRYAFSLGHLELPFIASIEGKGGAIYGAYRLLQSYNFEGKHSTTTLVGATFGFRIGNRWGIIAEGTFLESLRRDLVHSQINAAIFFLMDGGFFQSHRFVTPEARQLP